MNINMDKVMKAYISGRSSENWAELYKTSKKIDDALDTVQKLSRVRTIKIVNICERLMYVERELSITKKAMEGIVVDIDLHAQNFPNKYKGIPESTHFTVTFKKGHWVLTDIYRGHTRRAGHCFNVCLTEEAKSAIVDRFTTF